MDKYNELRSNILAVRQSVVPQFPTLKRSGHTYAAVMTQDGKSVSTTFCFNPDSWASKDMSTVEYRLLTQLGYHVNSVGGAGLVNYSLDSLLQMEEDDTYRSPAVEIVQPQKHVVIKGSGIRYNEPPTEAEKAKRAGRRVEWKTLSDDVVLVVVAVSDWMDEKTTEENNALIAKWLEESRKVAAYTAERANIVIGLIDKLNADK
jgi:hypothetical protein